MSDVKEVMPVADPVADGIVVPCDANANTQAPKEDAPKQ